ncbi:F-box/kelch-repeat protein At2g24250-like [Carex rostrata]
MKSNKIKSRWSDLPTELVIAIAGNLTEFTDHLRFQSVCSHWRSSFLSHSHTLRLPQQLPWLAFPSTSSTHFYSLSEDRVYSNPPPMVADNSKLFGSSSGWLLSVSGRNRPITASLVNPFTGALIELPCLDPCSPLWNGMVYTLVWDRSDLVVVTGSTRGPRIFYCRLGESTWASIEYPYSTPHSITFYEGRFYILNFSACQTVVLDGETLEQITVIDAPYNDYPIWTHLFVSSGELLVLATWNYDGLPVYNVQRADLNDEYVEWIEVNDIGDRALFVDNLHCFSVEVGDHGLLRRNCIYSAESKTSGGSRNSLTTCSISIFDLANDSWEHLEGALSKFRAASCGAISLPSWVLPSLS